MRPADHTLLAGTGLRTALTEILATLSAAGSVVLVDDAMASALRSDGPRRAALVTSERVTSDRL